MNRCGRRPSRCFGKAPKASTASSSRAASALSTVKAPPSTLRRARKSARVRSPKGSRRRRSSARNRAGACELRERLAPDKPSAVELELRVAAAERARTMADENDRAVPRSVPSSVMISASVNVSSALVPSSTTSSDARR